MFLIRSCHGADRVAIGSDPKILVREIAMNAEEITLAIDRLVVDIAPTAAKRKMYGGIVFEAEADNPDTRFGGYFVYAKHVGMEFTKGALLDDPDGILQGRGKMRRHIKLTSLADVEEQRVGQFVRQAIRAVYPAHHSQVTAQSH